jgi:hypothetical protein
MQWDSLFFVQFYPPSDFSNSTVLFLIGNQALYDGDVV